MKTDMRNLLVGLFGGISLLCSVARAEQFSGIIVYMDPPIGAMKVAETISYAAIEQKSVAYSNVRLVSGETREIQNAGIIALLPIQASGAATAAVIERRANDAVTRFPSVRSSVEAFLGRFRQTQAELARRTAMPAQPNANAAPKGKLILNGVGYTSVSLEAVSGDVAKVFHSDGIVNIPLAALTKEQIASLNATSSTVHIDGDWAEKKKLADLEKTKRLEEESKRAIQLAAMRRDELVTKGHQLEDAARYEDALIIYQEAHADSDLKRLASSMAANYETQKDYESAAEYFEKAGLFSEAGRVRKTYNMSESVSSTRLGSEELFQRCAPATVSIVTVERKGFGVGSGFFVHKGGYILTNRHVIEGARNITVLVDKNEYPAHIVAQSNTPDLALLKIELEEHPTLDFADSDRVKPGAAAFTIGTPKALPKSITGGMVSAVDRQFNGNNVFQISVLINHGNSGGPLLNEAGKVIGVTTFGEGTAAIVDGVHIGSDVQGINYAIKSNETKALLRNLPR